MIKPEVVNQLNAIHELRLLMFLESNGEWIHSSYSRHILSDSLSIAEVTLKVALKYLKDKGFIDRTSKGIYKINTKVIQ
jgi:predicted transcriptional regulator of viral defense system